MRTFMASLALAITLLFAPTPAEAHTCNDGKVFSWTTTADIPALVGICKNRGGLRSFCFNRGGICYLPNCSAEKIRQVQAQYGGQRQIKCYAPPVYKHLYPNWRKAK